jgi:hypothetical protein
MKKKTDKWVGKTVKVEWKHIAKGEPGIPESCPIAHAIKELGARDVEVSETIRIGKQDYAMPRVADTFVSKFDDDRVEAKPISFKIGKEVDSPKDWIMDW